MTSMYRGLSYNIIVCSPYIAHPLHIYSSPLLASPESPPFALALRLPLLSLRTEVRGRDTLHAVPGLWVDVPLCPPFVLTACEKGGLTW